MDIILKQAQARLISQVPALKYVDEDWGQLDLFGQHPPTQWPCALLDITGAAWSNTGKGVQLGIITLKVRIADLRLTNTSGKAPQGQKDAAAAIWGLLRDVHAALHGWTGDKAYSSLIRTSNSRVKRDDGVRIYEVTYTCELLDDSPMPNGQTVKLGAGG